MGDIKSLLKFSCDGYFMNLIGSGKQDRVWIGPNNLAKIVTHKISDTAS